MKERQWMGIFLVVVAISLIIGGIKEENKVTQCVFQKGCEDIIISTINIELLIFIGAAIILGLVLLFYPTKDVKRILNTPTFQILACCFMFGNIILLLLGLLLGFDDLAIRLVYLFNLLMGFAFAYVRNLEKWLIPKIEKTKFYERFKRQI